MAKGVTCKSDWWLKRRHRETKLWYRDEKQLQRDTKWPQRDEKQAQADIKTTMKKQETFIRLIYQEKWSQIDTKQQQKDKRRPQRDENNCKDTKMYNKETQMTTKRLKTKSTQNITKHLWKDEEKISNRRKVTKAKRQKKMILKLKTSIKRHTATTKIQNYNKEAKKRLLRHKMKSKRQIW